MGLDPGLSILIGCVATLVVGLLPGLVNGWLVAYLKVPPFIATFSMLGVCHGVSELIINGVYAMGLPKLASDIGSGHMLYIGPGGAASLFSEARGRSGRGRPRDRAEHSRRDGHYRRHLRLRPGANAGSAVTCTPWAATWTPRSARGSR